MDILYEKIKKYDVQTEEDIEEKIRSILDKDNENNSLKKYNIKHWVSNRSFGELIDMYEYGEIRKPEMQREFVWDSEKCSRLIESILLGLPIPPLFLLEVGNSEYEIVDGYQRLTTLFNYINGFPWSGKKEGKKQLASKLSSKVSEEIRGCTFKQLSPENQRILKRSTIPLIEFKQIEPDNYCSKYLIFERINTGSVKLNPMQIRKALAHGIFMDSLYENADKNEKFLKLFSSNALKKDQHVEAYLRVIVMSDIYNEEIFLQESGIVNILNNYCEMNKDKVIEEAYNEKFDKAIEILYEVFGDANNIGKRVEKNKEGYFEYVGLMNVAILEATLGTIISNIENLDSTENMRNKFNNKMYEIVQNAINGIEDNPFSQSTGTINAIKRRFEICKECMVK